MIPFGYRFHGHGGLRYVMSRGRVARGRHFIVKAHPNTRGKASRVAAIVSKKVHKSAVGRNRMRRRVYEIVRPTLQDITVPHDIAIIIVSPDVRSLPAEQLRTELLGQIRHLEVYQKP